MICCKNLFYSVLLRGCRFVSLMCYVLRILIFKCNDTQYKSLGKTEMPTNHAANIGAYLQTITLGMQANEINRCRVLVIIVSKYFCIFKLYLIRALVWFNHNFFHLYQNANINKNVIFLFKSQIYTTYLCDVLHFYTSMKTSKRTEIAL